MIPVFGLEGTLSSHFDSHVGSVPVTAEVSLVSEVRDAALMSSQVNGLIIRQGAFHFNFSIDRYCCDGKRMKHSEVKYGS